MKKTDVIESILVLTEYLRQTNEEEKYYHEQHGIHCFRYDNELKQIKKYLRYYKDEDLEKLVDAVNDKRKETIDYYYMSAYNFIFDGLNQGDDYCNGEPFGLYDLLLSEYGDMDLYSLVERSKKLLKAADRTKICKFMYQANITQHIFSVKELERIRPRTFTKEDKEFIEELRGIKFNHKIGDNMVVLPTDEVFDIVIEILTSLRIPTNDIVFRQACIKAYKQMIKEKK